MDYGGLKSGLYIFCVYFTVCGPLQSTTNQNFIVDPNIQHANVVQPAESILTQMKLLDSPGFKDGLAYGLTKAQSNAVHQIVNNSNNNMVQSATAPMTINNNSIINNICQQPSSMQQQLQHQQQIIQNNLCLPGVSTQITTTTTIQSPANNQSGAGISNNKQKNLPRKHRQVTLPFDNNNLTSSEAQQVRSQPIGEDDNSSFIRTCLEETFQQKVRFEIAVFID